MKIRTETPQAQTFGAATVKKFTIKQDHKTFRAFSDGLYSDKISSIIRELASNAIDSHRKAGNLSVPFEIFLPCENNPKFSLRDYGTGLTIEQIDNIYTVYGESTKEDSNDDIGGFGLGSKTPFAYSDQFFVRSYVDGTVYTFSFYFDEDEPAYLQIGEDSTDEPNGLEIFFDVDDMDFNEFANKAKRVLVWGEIVPNIWGSSEEENGFFKQNETTNKKEAWLLDHNSSIFFENDLFAICGHSYLSKINFNQGGVIYPMDNVSDFDGLSLIKSSLPAHNLRIILKCDIGTLELSRSRESLSLSKKVTIPNLNILSQKIIDLSESVLLEAISDNSSSSYTMNSFLTLILNRDLIAFQETTIGKNSYLNFLLTIAKNAMASNKSGFDLPFKKEPNLVDFYGREICSNPFVTTRFFQIERGKWKSLQRRRSNKTSLAKFSQEKLFVICKDGKTLSGEFLNTYYGGSNAKHKVLTFDIKKKDLPENETQKSFFDKNILPNVLEFYGANIEDIELKYTSDIVLDTVDGGRVSTRNKFTFITSTKQDKDFNVFNDSLFFKNKPIIIIDKKSSRVMIDGEEYSRDYGFNLAHKVAFVTGHEYSYIISANAREVDDLIKNGANICHIDTLISKVKKNDVDQEIVQFIQSFLVYNSYNSQLSIVDQEYSIIDINSKSMNTKNPVDSYVYEKKGATVAYHEIKHNINCKTHENVHLNTNSGTPYQIENILSSLFKFRKFPSYSDDNCLSFYKVELPEVIDYQAIVSDIIGAFPLINNMNIPKKESDSYCEFEKNMIEYMSKMRDVKHSLTIETKLKQTA